MTDLRELLVVSLGTMRYAEALELQRAVARARIAQTLDQDILLLVEHPHVVTLGRSSKHGHVIASTTLLAERGVELFEVERGGDVTYHGPGQLVGYPIVDLKRHKEDLHWYLRRVEQALIEALGAYGIEATRNVGYTGVWVGASGEDRNREPGTGNRSGAASAASARVSAFPVPNRKIASIGVHARDWVTWHGFALNVTTDLSYFDLIIPCGIPGVDMTSVARECGPSASIDVPTVGTCVAQTLADAFALQPVELALDELQERLSSSASPADV